MATPDESANFELNLRFLQMRINEFGKSFRSIHAVVPQLPLLVVEPPDEPNERRPAPPWVSQI